MNALKHILDGGEGKRSQERSSSGAKLVRTRPSNRLIVFSSYFILFGFLCNKLVLEKKRFFTKKAKYRNISVFDRFFNKKKIVQQIDT